jgi:THO complex subunit 2
MFLSNVEEAGATEEGAASAFLTFCIYPRFLSSPEDALFCAHFVKLMHKMKVPGLSVVELIDGIVNAVTGSLYCMTEDEAGNAAIFLNEIWKSANSWRYDNDSFATELKSTVSRLCTPCLTLNCRSLIDHCCLCFIQPGSRLSKAFAQEQGIDDHATTDGITHDDYKTIFSQWHLKIGSAAVGCLNSSEYMHTRSALIILSRMVLVYPTQPKVGDKFLEILTGLQADESRPDIRATAQGYASQLAKARDEGEKTYP